MLTSLRRLAVTRLKPVIGDRAWITIRKFDVRRERRRQALEAEIAGKARRRLLREQRLWASQTLARTATDAGLSESQRRALGEIDPLLVAQPKARIAILGGTETGVIAGLIADRFPAVAMSVIGTEADESERHVRLAASAPYHLILATGERADPAELLTNVLFHLKVGGLLVICDTGVDQARPNGLPALLARLRVRRMGGGLDEAEPVSKDELHLARAIRRVVIGDEYVMIENRKACLAKLTEAETSAVLTQVRPAFGTVLDRVAPELLAPKSVVRDHTDHTVVRHQPDIMAPALEIREYHGVLCAPGQLVVRGNALLAETYRHHLRPRLRNRRVADIAPRFGRVRIDISEPRHVDGAYFHWDSEFPGHFGHVLTEQVSRLWGLQSARDRFPGIRVLLGRRPGQSAPMSFELAILAACGFTGEDVFLYDKPTMVDTLVSATPMLSMPEYVSPRIGHTWDVVGDALTGDATGRRHPSRIFCGRRTAKRACTNAPEVEELFVAAGFEIVHPENLSLADQVAMFRGADMVAGYAGSALFTLMFCPEPKRVIIVAPESYTATNEYLIGAVRGHSFDVFWSRPESAAFRSPYAFDLGREGRLLGQCLASLD